MVVHEPLLLKAILKGIEVTGVIKNGKPQLRSQYSVSVSVDENEVTKATCELSSTMLKFMRSSNHEIMYAPSSAIKITVSRSFSNSIKAFNHYVGQYEGKVVDLLKHETEVELTGKEGKSSAMKMKMSLVPVPVPDDLIKEFMDGVDADIAHLSINGNGHNIYSNLGQVLKLTTSIMDKVSQVHPILSASWSAISFVFQAVQGTIIQDKCVQSLAEGLRELLAIANAVPNLPDIEHTSNVIEDISRMSLQTASVIHDYTRSSFAGRTAKAQILGIESRIADCQYLCDKLKETFHMTLDIDTNLKVDKIDRTLNLIKDDELANKIVYWLSPPDLAKNREEMQEKIQDNTCSWFYSGDQFNRWLREPAFIWVKGKSGCGKSVLCSSVIDRLPKATPSVAVAYFIFDARDGQTDLQLHGKLLRSLVSQVSDSRHGGIPASLADLHKSCGSQQPLTNQLEDILRNILNGFTHTYIVIDALDECSDRKKTLAWVKRLVTNSRKMNNLHIVVTSRPERDIEDIFEVLNPVSIDVSGTSANDDIFKYLELEISTKFSKFEEDIRNEIKDSLWKRADGSFRWVALQLAHLEDCLSDYDLRQQMEHLPKDLDEVYGRILKKIDGPYRDDTVTLLEWLAFSKCPLSIAQLAETVTVDFKASDGPLFNATKRYRHPRDILVRCSSLVAESDGFVKLAHFSVKEYLLSNRTEKHFKINESDAHTKISETSITYLLQFDSVEPLTEDMLRLSPLAEYAAEFWIDHARLGGMDSSLVTSVMQLLTSATALTNWVRIYNIDGDYRQDQQNLKLHRADIWSPLYYASVAGLYQISRQLLLQEEADVNAVGGEYGNALQAASSYGHESIVKLLLEKGADVNAVGGYNGSALYTASSYGHESIVKLLLEKAAEVNAVGGYYGNALQAASFNDHTAIVKLLLEKGTDVNAIEGYYGNALQAASHRGHEAIMRLLLEKGADVNAMGGYYGNTLQAASSKGHAAIVELLLEKGADVNLVGGEYGHTLQAASFYGHESIVRLLLEKGADVNLVGGRYGNALQAASYCGYEVVVGMLLEKGADVNLVGGKYGSTLQAASSEGNESIVKLLLENGVDVNMVGGEYGNALYAASSNGHAAIVKLLLEKGVDVNMVGGEYGSALQVASSRGHEAIVRLLLEKGANVSLVGGYHGNALYASSSNGYLAIVKLLLEKGADVNAVGGEYGNALQAASSNGHAAIVKLLLEKGVDVNLVGGKYGNALYAASSNGYAEIVKLLLKKGVDVNLVGGEYGNALQVASSNGHEAIVKLLLEKGADVNLVEGYYGNALYASSSNGYLAIVKLLLEKGADVNLVGGDYGTALQAASSNGHAAVVKLLLLQRADVNAVGGYFGNALQAASYGGYEAIVRMLLKKGADVNQVGEKIGTALQAASLIGHEAVVKLLLQEGVNVNAVGGYFGNALQAASYGGYEAIVRMLLEKGADVSLVGGYFGNALQAASYSGHGAIMRLLLQEGVDVNAMGGQYGNALQAAS